MQLRHRNQLIPLLGSVVSLCLTACFPPRSIDGSGNHPIFHDLGATETTLLRLLDSDYGDGVSTLAGASRPSARLVSNIVISQPGPMPNPYAASDYIWQWGQFLDHDIDLTEGADPAEPADIPVPLGDPYFDPFNTGTQVIQLNRSRYDPSTSPREQLNGITTWIDASNVYGSDAVRANELRMNDGSGRLKTSAGNLLPFNTAGLPNAGGTGADLFLGGDVRANEQAALTCMHTLFVREHNQLATLIGNAAWWLSGDEIYEAARAIVGAEMQAITYREFLPALLGKHAIKKYRRYRPWTADPRISNVFSTAAYRFGHSMLSPTLKRIDANGDEIPAGHLALRDAFFAPSEVVNEGIDPLLRGLASQVAQNTDMFVIDDVRNFLFGPPGSGGFDLASLNIQRGRDHGLPSYNEARDMLGLPKANSFADVSSNPTVQANLAAAYATVDDIDAWVGGLAEDHVAGAVVGELVFTILRDQFEALRDGDRFYYKRHLPRFARRFVEHSTLAQIIRRNTEIGAEMSDDVWHVE